MNGLLIPSRKNESELLDVGAGTRDDVRHSLNDLKRLNQYLGGMRAVLKHLSPRMKTQSSRISILDIGTGDASLLKAVSGLIDKQGHRLNLIGLDLMARHLNIAQQKNHLDNLIHLTQGNAIHLPFADRSVDFVICSLLLHHLTPSQVGQLLREAYRCAKTAIIISDLVRGWLPYIGYKMIQPLFNLHPITRHDGEISIMRAFTVQELKNIAIDANLSSAKVYRHPMFRMTLVIDK